MNYAVEICKLSNSIKPSDIIPRTDIPIYHYTSPIGFKGIIENRTLRFTDRYFLNDYSEGIHVLDLCIENISSLVPDHEKFREELFKQCKARKETPQKDSFYVYLCSFSMDKDSLCLWNYYTKGDNIQGYNLCFNSESLCKNLSFESNLEDGRLPTIWNGKVIYEENQQLEIVKNVVDKFFQFSEDSNHQHDSFTIGLLVDKLIIVGTFFKKHCFHIEHEYRLAIELHRNLSDGKFSAIKETQGYYEKNGILIPFLDVHFKPEVLIEIGISPTLDLTTTTNSVYRATMKDYPQIQESHAVKQSGIPVRY